MANQSPRSTMIIPAVPLSARAYSPAHVPGNLAVGHVHFSSIVTRRSAAFGAPAELYYRVRKGEQWQCRAGRCARDGAGAAAGVQRAGELARARLDRRVACIDLRMAQHARRACSARGVGSERDRHLERLGAVGADGGGQRVHETCNVRVLSLARLRKGRPSRGHQEAIKRPSRGHQEVIKRLSRGHQEAIKRPSRGHQEAIKRPSRGHPCVLSLARLGQDGDHGGDLGGDFGG